MVALNAITAGTVAAAPTGAWSTAATGDLEVIASAVDGDYGELTDNTSGSFDQGYLLDATPTDLSTLDGARAAMGKVPDAQVMGDLDSAVAWAKEAPWRRGTNNISQGKRLAHGA